MAQKPTSKRGYHLKVHPCLYMPIGAFLLGGGYLLLTAHTVPGLILVALGVQFLAVCIRRHRPTAAEGDGEGSGDKGYALYIVDKSDTPDS